MALKKNPNPTFKQTVEIPVPGEKPEKVECTFKHKTATVYKEFIADCAGREDAESILEILTDWKLVEVFGEVSKDSITALFEAYPGAPGAFFTAYVKGLHQGRSGNL